MAALQWLAVALVPVGYLLGTFPSAVIVARRRGVDILSAGSGNPGASNVIRVLGWRVGAVVLLFDFAKGAAASGLGLAVGGRGGAYLLGIAAVIGHTFPFGRKGGKGVEELKKGKSSDRKGVAAFPGLMKFTNASADDIVIDVQEIRKPDTNAQLVSETVATQLERRIAFRRAMKKAVEMAMTLGAEGIRIQCSGRLGGADIARREWQRKGRVPLHTLRENIDYGFFEARTVYGKIGVKCWICKKESDNN